MSIFRYMLIHREDITLFGDSELYLSPECCKLSDEIYELRQRLLQCCGKENEELLDEYTEAVESQEDFVAEHYFEQGYLAGQRQRKKRKKRG